MTEQPEQPQLSEEEIKKRMELMKENCIFCKIIKKEIPANIVFEDDLSIAVLDINPATTGHLLLMPKEHYMIMPLVPDNILGHVNVIAKSLCPLLIETFNCTDVTIYIANGAAAGQQSQHFMVHLIPRYDKDGLDFDLSNKKGKILNEMELETLKNNLKEKLQKGN
jgi:histidine triad (HIT) family protein